MKHSRLTVVGTGTEIGKTHAGCCLLLALREDGVMAAGLKPVESGVVPGALTDAEKLERLSAGTVRLAPYRLEEAISPHLAARREGRVIETRRVVGWVEEHEAELLLVETAGGLLSPVNEEETNLDLVVALAAPVVVVSVNRLGVLHDVGAVLLALETKGIRASLVLLNEAKDADPSTDTNREELERRHGIPVVVLPRAEPNDPRSVAAARTALARLA